MKKINYALIAVLLLFVASNVSAHHRSKLVEVSIVDNRGYELDKIPVESDRQREKAYIQAKKGMNYGVKIRNRTNKRIGVVIAVDGRNIISGKKSYLTNDERMYILNPHETRVYKGWRTSRNQVNRFYFTNSKYSYASSWGDDSAMGVIAVAAFKEKRYYARQKQKEITKSNRHANKKQPGTGFGEEHYSPSIKVHFRPEKVASFESFLKYEWKKTLCKKGLVDCSHRYEYSYNRFWEDDDDFAPYPPF